jgi:phage-related protein
VSFLRWHAGLAACEWRHDPLTVEL